MAHGGKRPGAGRPKGSGRFGGLECERVWLPIDKKHEVYEFLETDGYSMPILEATVQAGSPVLTSNTESEKRSIIHFLTDHPMNTFLIRAEGESMLYANIQSGDMLIVDPKLEVRDGSIVVASIDNECTVKRFKRIDGRAYLMPENPDYTPIPITDSSSVQIFGVVKKKIGDVH